MRINATKTEKLSFLRDEPPPLHKSVVTLEQVASARWFCVMISAPFNILDKLTLENRPQELGRRARLAPLFPFAVVGSGFLEK